MGLRPERSARSTARLLGRATSTVSREIKRNGGYDRYRVAQADEQAWVRARRPKRREWSRSSSITFSIPVLPALVSHDALDHLAEGTVAAATLRYVFGVVRFLGSEFSPAFESLRIKRARIDRR